jgi:3-oxoacyl-[acyl-carrier protein] reductase
MEKVAGKWALVTGASRGVGEQIVLGLAEQGCNLVLHSRKVANTEVLSAQLAGRGITAVAVEGELTDPAQVDRLLDAVAKAAPQIDILYNNAALQSPYRSDPWNVPGDDFRQSLEANFISLARLCYRFVPPMIERGWGRVINVTSGICDQPELASYAVSKAAVDKFVMDFKPTLEGTGVAMNLLDPGWLKTDMGGPDAPGEVESVLPGALVPALISKPVNGKLFRAQDYVGMSLEEALM